jgi:hypothetical protein
MDVLAHYEGFYIGSMVWIGYLELGLNQWGLLGASWLIDILTAKIMH